MAAQLAYASLGSRNEALEMPLTRSSAGIHGLLWLLSALAVPATASAQSPTSVMQGFWTDGRPEECRTNHVQLTLDGNEMRLDDQAGGSLTLRIVSVSPDLVTAVPVGSNPQNAQWRFQPLGVSSMQISNLPAGRTYAVRRCLTPAAEAGQRASPTETIRGPTMTVRPVTTASPQPIGPSFACDAPAAQRDPLPQLICGDARLSRLDLSFVQAFQALIRQAGEAGQSDLRREAIDFQASVRDRCGLPAAQPLPRGRSPAPSPQMSVPVTAPACIASLYQAQRQAWIDRLGPPARQEAERPLEQHVQLQASLVELGFLPAGTVADGNYGPATRSAIGAWQRTRGMPDTGLLSDGEAAALLSSVQAARAASQREAIAQADLRRREQAAIESLQAEARIRAAAELQEQERVERQRQAAAEHDDAVDRLSEQISGGDDEAVVLVSLGREGSRIRRNLRGDLAAMGAQPPASCAMLAPGIEAGFVDFARDRYPQLLKSDKGAFSSSCLAIGSIVEQDIALVSKGALPNLSTRSLQALQQALVAGNIEVVAHIPLQEYRDDVERRRRQAADEAARLADLSGQIRRDALDGTLDDWAILSLAPEVSGNVCVVGSAEPQWIDVLRAVLPPQLIASARSATADPDADQQFGRLLSGACTALVARGKDFGDVLHGMAANKRNAIVLPMRIPPAKVAAAVQAQVAASRPAPLAVAPLPPSPPPSLQAQPSLSTTSYTPQRSSASSAAMPDLEAALIDVVAAARTQYESAGTELARGASRPMRRRAFCDLFAGTKRANDWVGSIETLTTNGEGKGVLSVRVAPGISVKTWNNALSDTGDQTLVEPISPLYAKLLRLRVGQRVQFSGRFFDSGEDCIRESSLTMQGSIKEPEFVFQFSSVDAVP